MSGSTRFEHRGSDNGTATYQTFDERAVSREEIDRAVRHASIAHWLVSPTGIVVLAVVVVVVLGVALWLIPW